MDREMETSLENLVRVGTVTWADPGKRVARVKFRDTGFPSAILPVLAHRPYLWMPEVNATVLCLYLPGFNMDGYIIGEITS